MAPIDKLSVVIVAIFAAIFLGERLAPLNWAGAALIAVIAGHAGWALSGYRPHICDGGADQDLETKNRLAHIESGKCMSGRDRQPQSAWRGFARPSSAGMLWSRCRTCTVENGSSALQMF